MEVTDLVPSTQPSTVSPDGIHVATIYNSQLEVRRLSTLEVVRSIPNALPSQSRFVCLRWSPVTRGAGASNRVLVSDEDTTRVWDLQDAQWCATIDNGSGGMGKVANVEFGADDSEVLVFSSFGSKVTVWSLWTGKSIEIKDPKFTRRGYGRNSPGRNGIFALLTRPGAQDSISLHIPGSYSLIKSFTPQTIDAQGLRWSPDGRWLAVWDTPISGYKILIYTADGNLYRTYSGDYFDDELKGLGVKSIEWTPNSDFLVVAGFEKTMTILGTRTFSPAVQLSHPNTVKPSRTDLWQEDVTTSGRSYKKIKQPMTPPAASVRNDDTSPQIGISILACSADGSFLATKEDSMPTTVWIWDLSQMTCSAVLIQHSVVKKLLWHPTDPNSLLIQCIQGESVLYHWHALEAGPRVLIMPQIALSGKAEAHWVPKPANRKSMIMLGDHRGFAVAYPDGRNDTLSPYLEAEKDGGGEAGDDSENDSVYNALTGKNGAQQTSYAPTEDIDTAQVFPDDTFHHRKGVDVF